MKNIRVKQVEVIIIALIMLIGIPSFAQRSGQNDGRKNGRNGTAYCESRQRTNFMTQLDLTDEQKTKIGALDVKLQKEMIQHNNQIREREAQLTSALTQDNIDQEKVNKLVDEIGDLKATVRKDRLNKHLQVRAVLTEDQKVKFDQHLATRANSGRRGYRGHRF